ncbi:MAG TPA: hypothetical protein VFK49_02095 [Stellaceae bacterium]|nr:hypothetical protein [Stellaceae bacterium]
MLAALATVLPADRVLADDRLHQSDVVWKAADNCARAAVKAYPDYTPEALAQREAYRRLCLRRANVPGGDNPRAPAAAGGEIGK